MKPVVLICGVDMHRSELNLLAGRDSGKFRVLLNWSPSPNDVDLLRRTPAILTHESIHNFNILPQREFYSYFRYFL